MDRLTIWPDPARTSKKKSQNRTGASQKTPWCNDEFYKKFVFFFSLFYYVRFSSWSSSVPPNKPHKHAFRRFIETFEERKARCAGLLLRTPSRLLNSINPISRICLFDFSLNWNAKCCFTPRSNRRKKLWSFRNSACLRRFEQTR